MEKKIFDELSIIEIIKNKLKPNLQNIKLSFLSVYIFGIIAHYFVFSNIMPGHDYAFFYEKGTAPIWFAMGRFFAQFVLMFQGNTYLPWLNGLISLFYVFIAVFFICKIFKINKPILIICIGAVMVTFPTITSANCYFIASPLFNFSLMCCVLAVYFIDKYRYGFLLSIIILVASMGVYQAYIAFVATLMILILFRQLLLDQDKVKTIFLKGIKYICILFSSALLYYFVWKLTMKIYNIIPTNYRGSDQVGRYALSELIPLIKISIKNLAYFYMPFKNHSIYPDFFLFIFWISMIILACMVFKIILSKKIYKNIYKMLLFVFLLFCLPIAMNLMAILNKAELPHLLMKYAFIAPWLIFIIAYEICDILYKSIKKKNILMIFLMVFFATTVYVNVFIANASYTKLYANYQAGTMLANRIVDRIENTKGYVPGKTKVYFIGTMNPEYYANKPWPVSLSRMTGVYGNSSITYEKPLIKTITNILGVNMNIVNDLKYDVPDNYDYVQDKVKDLPSFPNNDCITFVNDVLVVKLNDNVAK